MRPIRVTAGPFAAGSDNAIALSQTPSGAGALTLNGSLASGGVATMDNPRRVLLTFAANETGHNFVITGADVSGSTISETIAGTTAGTVYSVLDYKTVTSITISAAATGGIKAGTNSIGGSPWVRFDDWAPPEIAIQCTVSGTINYTVQQTLDDPNSPNYTVTPAAVTWVNHPDTNLVSATTTVQGNYAYMPVFARVLVNSSTSPGTVTATFLQSANVQE